MELSIKRMAMLAVALGLTAGVVVNLATAQTKTNAGDSADRTVLPLQEPSYPPITELDARKATPPPRFEVKVPQGAPNVVIVLIDDMGFGAPSTFGGGISMPTLDRLAQGGLRYNHFHTTALCSPTRMALLTGRNHHTANTGAIMEISTSFPGNTGIRPQSVAPLAEMLRLNGYSTAAFGKYHETPAWEASVSGPYDRWPTHSGFDKFYGFIGGETNQWTPLLYDGVSKVELPDDPNYHLTTDLANQAIAWVRFQQTLTPDKPFFVYFAPGATHAPHHVPKAWADKYKGKFDGGWDKYREETLERQIRLGVVPPGTKLAPKPAAIKDWDTLTADEKRLFTRQMEVFAGFAEQTDHEIGRLVKAIEDLGVMDNTLFIYIAGDNGASAEGGMVGLFNEATYFNAVPENLQDLLERLDEWGSPSTYPHMAAGWAVATDTPFTWTKQVASNFGGTRNSMVIHWPTRIKAKGELRTQFSHVTDIAPTVLEAVGLPFPKSVNGTEQTPFEGASFVYSFDDAKAKTRHPTQYFEILGNRAIYHDGWLAGTVHRAPWEYVPRRPLAEDIWELYNASEDFSLANDLASQEPAKLKEMKDLFMTEGAKYHVLPIDDRAIERFDPKQAGRPDLMGGRTSLTVYEGMTGMMENAFINIKNRSNTITAEVDVPPGRAEGVILCQGGRFGGWSLYLRNGKPTYTYNWVGLQKYSVASPQALPAGKATIRYEFVYDGGKPGSGGTGVLFVNGQKMAETRIEHTNATMFSSDDAADVGVDEGTPVTEDYRERDNRFTGKIHSVTVQVE
jgi:arylsulfatase